jgi:hypothetical protein
VVRDEETKKKQGDFGGENPNIRVWQYSLIAVPEGDEENAEKNKRNT